MIVDCNNPAVPSFQLRTTMNGDCLRFTIYTYCPVKLFCSTLFCFFYFFYKKWVISVTFNIIDHNNIAITFFNYCFLNFSHNKYLFFLSNLLL